MFNTLLHIRTVEAGGSVRGVIVLGGLHPGVAVRGFCPGVGYCPGVNVRESRVVWSIRDGRATEASSYIPPHFCPDLKNNLTVEFS